MSDYDHQHVWYARRDGRVRGPFTAEELRRYLLLGRICEDDELSRDGMEWRLVPSGADAAARHPGRNAQRPNCR